MSETGNPLWYHTGDDNAIALTEEGEGLTKQQVTERHWGPTDRANFWEPLDPSATYLTFLAEQEWDRWPGVFLPSKDKWVRVASLPLAPEGFKAYGGAACQADDVPDMTLVRGQCKRPVRTLINGWSAGPTSFCAKHLRAVLVSMSSEAELVEGRFVEKPYQPKPREKMTGGIWWRPVRLSYVDLLFQAEHNFIP